MKEDEEKEEEKKSSKETYWIFLEKSKIGKFKI